ncbi:MAG: YncE family protein [Flavobacteriales bacterium]|nr:YncE family protein [Flavobacteriales bacterium]
MSRIPTRKKSLITFVALAAVIGLSAFEAFEMPEVGSSRSFTGVPASDFANFESGHVHPLDMTPDSTRLLAVNTANNSLEVFTILPEGLRHAQSITVGVDPVTVRVRNNTEAWVVNRVSDNVSVVDLTTGMVVRTLSVEDEPADVVFAGGRAWVTCSERKSVQYFDLNNLAAAPGEVLLVGEQPRAMAVSPDGSKIYAAFFESGNQTTVVPGNEFMAAGFRSPQNGNGVGTIVPNDVTKPAGPYGGAVPVPNAGTGFEPPLNPTLPIKTDMQSLVVRKNSAGQWMDDNGGNWTNIVSGGAGVRMNGWDLLDHDVAVIDVNNPTVANTTYQKHLGNILMAMAVNPATDRISVVGTDATNEIRFEPNLNGKFLRVNVSQFMQGNQASTAISDLNPHLTYETSSVPEPMRKQSIGDPRGIAWKSDGTQAFITGMGSNNVIVVDMNGNRVGAEPIKVGQGPTGIKLHETRERFYVLNKFDASISMVDMGSGEEISRTTFFDPTPEVIKKGRPHLYDTHAGSGTGHISCGSCHVDGRWDRLAWDLGDPSGEIVTVGGKEFHPMKGLKTTQWLLDITGKGTGALHWRGDKETFHDFAGAFQHLQGLDAPADPVLMQEFSDFLAACYHGPNPYRNWRTSGAGTEPPYQLQRMNSSTPVPYNRVRGPGTTFQPIRNAGVRLFVAMNVNCTHCHQMQTGRGDFEAAEGNENMGTDLRTAYRKLGFYYTANSTAGFGFMADGGFETWVNQTGALTHYFGDYQAELLAWGGGVDVVNSPQSLNNGPGLQHTDNHSHPAIGLQVTINGPGIPNGTGASNPRNVDFLRDLANDFPNVSLIVKGRWQGEMRGFYYAGGNNYQPDLNGAPLVTHDALKAHAAADNASALTWTVVHDHVKVRAGVDRDSDGIYDYTDGDVELDLSMLLDGPMIGPVMRTDLRNAGLIPQSDPYGLGATASAAVMDRLGASAVVDWVRVELRDPAAPSLIVDEVAALLQSDGRVVMPDGSLPLRFADAPRGSYLVAVRHRNHLGTMTATESLFGTSVLRIDLSDPAVLTYGTAGRKSVGSRMALWGGDVNGDGMLRYTNSNNDRDPILVAIGGTVPTASVSGYLAEDVNLDGAVKYTGSDNDRDLILQNIGGTVPTNSRMEQMP